MITSGDAVGLLASLVPGCEFGALQHSPCPWTQSLVLSRDFFLHGIAGGSALQKAAAPAALDKHMVTSAAAAPAAGVCVCVQ